jgi:hypothetical protein
MCLLGSTGKHIGSIFNELLCAYTCMCQYTIMVIMLAQFMVILTLIEIYLHVVDNKCVIIRSLQWQIMNCDFIKSKKKNKRSKLKGAVFSCHRVKIETMVLKMRLCSHYGVAMSNIIYHKGAIKKQQDDI